MTHTDATIKDVANYGTLLIAHANAKRHKTEYNSVKWVDENKAKALSELSKLILSGNYRTSPYTKKIISDSGKERLIHKLPYYPDRIVHWAIMLQLEPMIMEMLTKHTHAALKGRGQTTALSEVRRILKEDSNLYCLKIDIKKYFPHIDHVILKEFYYSLINDYDFRVLLFENINSLKDGIPIGNYTSQFHANLYLDKFDKWLIAQGLRIVRYMDDLVIFAESKERLHRLKYEIEWYLTRNLNISLKENWQIFPVDKRGVDFVGYRIYRNRVLLRKKTWLSIRRRTATIRKNVEQRGYITETERSQLASDLGRTARCTPKIRQDIYLRIFKPVLDLAGLDIMKMKKLRKYYNGNIHNQTIKSNYC